jgi:hypothetical protein
MIELLKLVKGLRMSKEYTQLSHNLSEPLIVKTNLLLMETST